MQSTIAARRRIPMSITEILVWEFVRAQHAERLLQLPINDSVSSPVKLTV